MRAGAHHCLPNIDPAGPHSAHLRSAGTQTGLHRRHLIVWAACACTSRQPPPVLTGRRRTIFSCATARLVPRRPLGYFCCSKLLNRPATTWNSPLESTDGVALRHVVPLRPDRRSWLAIGLYFAPPSVVPYFFARSHVSRAACRSAFFGASPTFIKSRRAGVRRADVPVGHGVSRRRALGRASEPARANRPRLEGVLFILVLYGSSIAPAPQTGSVCLLVGRFPDRLLRATPVIGRAVRVNPTRS